MSKLRLLDLFSGIGGFSLGLERTGGFETVAFCEIEDFPRRVLAKHWPKVPCYHDIRDLTATRLAADGIAVDAICGGFPCQDFSRANGVWSSRPGLKGARSGLWSEYARLIRELRPKVVFVENVPDVCESALGVILGDLAEIGHDAEWDCLSATVAGLPHPRERLWLVSYPRNIRLDGQHRQRKQTGNTGGVFDALARSASHAVVAENRIPEPAVSRVVDGLSAGMVRAERIGRTKALGNAVVPQTPELLGNAYLQSLEAQS